MNLREWLHEHFEKLWATGFIYFDSMDSKSPQNTKGTQIMTKLKELVGSKKFGSALRGSLVPVFIEILKYYTKFWKKDESFRITMKNVSRQKKCCILEMLNENHALVFHHSLLYVRVALLTSTHDEERRNALKLMIILCEEMIRNNVLV